MIGEFEDSRAATFDMTEELNIFVVERNTHVFEVVFLSFSFFWRTLGVYGPCRLLSKWDLNSNALGYRRRCLDDSRRLCWAVIDSHNASNLQAFEALLLPLTADMDCAHSVHGANLRALFLAQPQVLPSRHLL